MDTDLITEQTSSCPAAPRCEARFGRELSLVSSGVPDSCLGSLRMAGSPVRCLHHGTETRALVRQQIWWAVKLQDLSHTRGKHAEYPKKLVRCYVLSVFDMQPHLLGLLLEMDYRRTSTKVLFG